MKMINLKMLCMPVTIDQIMTIIKSNDYVHHKKMRQHVTGIPLFEDIQLTSGILIVLRNKSLINTEYLKLKLYLYVNLLIYFDFF